MRYHHQNLTDGKLPLWRHGRAWFGPFHWGWNVFYRTSLLMFAFNWWGFTLYLRAFGFHMSWARRDDDDRGCWEVSWHDGCLWLEHPWVRQGGWSRSDPWWKKQIVLHVVDWLIGRTRYQATKGEAIDVVVPMPEGCYAAKATNRKAEWRRRWYWPTQRMSTWDIEIPGGIPFAGKGENSWDCGDDGLFGISGNFPTVEKAVAEVVESVLRSRRRHGYDSKGTGKTASVVLNAAGGAS